MFRTYQTIPDFFVGKFTKLIIKCVVAPKPQTRKPLTDSENQRKNQQEIINKVGRSGDY